MLEPGLCGGAPHSSSRADGGFSHMCFCNPFKRPMIKCLAATMKKPAILPGFGTNFTASPGCWGTWGKVGETWVSGALGTTVNPLRACRNPNGCEPSTVPRPWHSTQTYPSRRKTRKVSCKLSAAPQEGHSQPRGVDCAAAPKSLGPTQPGTLSSQQGKQRQNHSLRCVSDVSRDPIVPVSENFIFFVKFSLIFTNGHRKPFLFKIRLLFFSNSCFFQNLSL